MVYRKYQELARSNRIGNFKTEGIRKMCRMEMNSFPHILRPTLTWISEVPVLRTYSTQSCEQLNAVIYTQIGVGVSHIRSRD